MVRGRKPSPSVLVYWDIENCAPPSWVTGYEIVAKIRAGLEHLGPVVLFKTYCEVASNSSRLNELHAELQSSGVSLVHCPHAGQKDQVDKMIIGIYLPATPYFSLKHMAVDAMAGAHDHPESAIVIISGDRDYSYLVSTLRLRQRHIVVVCSGVNTHQSLMASASEVIYWETMARMPLAVEDDDAVDPDSATAPQMASPSSSVDQIPPISQVVPSEPVSRHPVETAIEPIPPVALSNLPIGSHSGRSSAENLGISIPSTPKPNDPEPQSPALSRLQSIIDSLSAKSDTSSPQEVSQSPPVKAGWRRRISSDASSYSPHPSPQASIPPSLGAAGNFQSSKKQIFCRTKFEPLLHILRLLRDHGIVRPLRSKVSAQLNIQYPTLYKDTEFTGWKSYIATAEEFDLVTLGKEEKKGTEWVSFGPLSRIPLQFITLYRIMVGFSKNKLVVPGPPVKNIIEAVERTERNFLDKYGYPDWDAFFNEARQALAPEPPSLLAMIAPERC